MNTTASAQGNAAAQLYVLASAPPDENPFKNWLTNEEIERHAYFNDDILEHAEEIDDLERRLAVDQSTYNIRQPAWDDSVSAQDRIAYYTDPSNGSDGMDGARAQRIVGTLREISELEDLILAELDEVRSEYRMLAEALHNGREQYVEHYGNAAALSEQSGITRERARRDGLGPGPQGQMVYLDSQMSAYEATYNDYKLIEQGFKYNTTREVLINLVWGAIAIIAVEIATAGIAKFVAIGAYALRATAAGRAAMAAGRAGEALIARFMALTEATRRRVVSVVRRGRRSEPDAPPRDGDTIQGESPRPNTATCAIGGSALC